MKKILLATIILAGCSSAYKINFTTTETPKEKTLKGIINRSIIETDTTFKWFGINYKFAQANVNAVNVFNQNKNNFKMIVFGGTWCEDTQNLLPMFYKLINQSNYPEKRITLVGVDRQKQSGNDLSAKYNIKNVPAFIVLKNDGTEVGRVVEYGKGEGIDNELAEIVNSIK
jgi:thiol-disulfide isomerase/thioredoxin